MRFRRITRTDLIRIGKIASFSAVILIIVGYAIFVSFPYTKGPSLIVFQPTNGTTIYLPTVNLVGQAKRISSLFMNGSPISIDEDGNFKETLVVVPGTNKIHLEANDQFKRSTSLDVTFFGSK